MLRITKPQYKTIQIIQRSGDGANSSLRRSKASTSGRKNSLSRGTVDVDTGDISDEFDTAVERNRKKTTSKTSKITSIKTTSGKKKPKPGGTTRRTWPLDQEKRLRKQFREEMKQGRQPGRAVCLEATKKYPHASKWQNIKDKIRNMTISDARKRSAISGRITKKQYEL